MSNEPEYSLQLSKPALIRVSTADGSKSFQVDLFEAWRFLYEDADKKPSQTLKWKAIVNYLKDKLGVASDDNDSVTESMAYEFNNAVRNLGASLDEALKKKLQTIVSSQAESTPASPPTGPTGPTDSSEPTSPTSPESQQ